MKKLFRELYVYGREITAEDVAKVIAILVIIWLALAIQIDAGPAAANEAPYLQPIYQTTHSDVYKFTDGDVTCYYVTGNGQGVDCIE